jgi:hypothetical protein
VARRRGGRGLNIDYEGGRRTSDDKIEAADLHTKDERGKSLLFAFEYNTNAVKVS